MRRTPRAIAVRLTVPLRRWARRWRRSMQARVVTTVLFVGVATVLVLGAFVVAQIRDGLIETRVDRILLESARDATSAQQGVDASVAATPGDLQALLRSVYTSLLNVGGDSRGLVVLQAQDNDSDLILTTGASDVALPTVVTAEMRQAMADGVTQPWQYTTWPGQDTAAVVVGEPLRLRDAGDYELYFVYSLADEQQTLALIQQVLLFGGAVLISLVLLQAWFVTLQAVRPVRQAARVASRLADGLLSERMTVRGADEMATLATTFNEMAESLQRQITRMEDLSRVQRRFVSDVSHELRTPLTTIRMASDILYDAREDFPAQVARSAELLSTQIDRFELLLSDLLEMSRIDAGAAQLEFELTDLADVVADEVDAIRPVAEDQGVRIELWVGSGRHQASMDRPRVGRIIRNLLSNAVEHAQGGPVDVGVASTSRGVAVVVRDYGLGLTHTQVERVFDRFWRADPARARTMGGTGLGLSIAREDALLHGGRLEAWGSPGEGAAFRLSLPRTSRGLGQQPVLALAMRHEEFEALGDGTPRAAGPTPGDGIGRREDA
ncbi:MtrAB system histidine kinase MtrB [Demequina zhanjiangensis]|uniref:Sensor histidine kinase MtrB n=1 Tax=Demequina zhanjiangensis TaxID=3051659 RepID=A0ABT8FXQ6_9MICO|nr:MtrAB system histidine kinase MtrB [Demequina sp. SYSU T00b26]MDN4471689.1 MtrAB system histidine kinase MtrB [Demequina sp. SYSU T00b26]